MGLIIILTSLIIVSFTIAILIKAEKKIKKLNREVILV